MELIGIIPAAGRATRLGDIPGSKEILQIKYQGKKCAVSEILINAYKNAGIKKVYFIIREGKWDIIDFYKNGHNVGIHISYLIMQHPHGVPFTLNEASPFVNNSYVALGFPDMLVKPENSFAVLYNEIKKKGSDLMLGVFPIESKFKWDMVELNAENEVTDIVIKKENTKLKYGWSIAIWGPKFTEFLNQRINEIIANDSDGKIKFDDDQYRELYPGDLFKEFIRRGNKVDTVIFEDGECIDLGTKDDLRKFQ